MNIHHVRMRKPLKGQTDKPICGLVAVSVVSGQPFKTVWNHFGKDQLRSWQGALSLGEILLGMNYFGAKLKRIPLSRMGFSCYKRPMLKQLVPVLAAKYPDRVFSVVTTGHIQTVSNFTIVDQGGKTHVDNHQFKRKRVLDIYLVESVNGKSAIVK